MDHVAASAATEGAPGAAFHFALSGMECAACARRAEKALAALPGVESAAVNFALGSAALHLAPGHGASGLALDAFAAALAPGGFAPVEVPLTLLLEGMHCAACVQRVEAALLAVPGVRKAEVNLALGTAHVTLWQGDGPLPLPALIAAVAAAGYTAKPEAEVDEGLTARGRNAAQAAGRRAAWAALFALPLFAAEMGGHLYAPFHHWLMGALPPGVYLGAQALLAALTLFGPGLAILRPGLRGLWRRMPDMNALVTLGAGAAFLYSLLVTLAPGLFPAEARAVYYEAAAVIVALVLTGRWLEARARGAASQAIARLLDLSPPTALVWQGEAWSEQPVATLQPGARLMARPGARIALDGVVEEGRSHVDEAMLTGEPQPVLKEASAPLWGGTVNGEGTLVYKVTAVGAGTVLARITALVQAAQAGKLPVQALIDKVTAIFVPVVLGVAALASLSWALAGAGAGPALIAGVSVLIIACPCAMGLATPVSILVASGRAAEMGIFFRNGAALQRLAGVQRLAFDKTGTLTEGRPALVGLAPVQGVGEGELLAWAAAVEEGSDHPLAATLRAAALAQGLKAPGKARAFRAHPGEGVEAEIKGQPAALGNARLAQQSDPKGTALFAEQAKAWESEGASLVYALRGGQVIGLLALADPPRAESAGAMAALERLGVETLILSGDAPEVAEKLAETLGVDRALGGLLPEDKLAELRLLGPGTGFVGDGINDAPALAAADVGLAIGSGTEVAIEAADVVLMREGPRAAVNALRLARATLRNIKQNLFWAFGYNVALIPVAAGALVPFGGPALSPMLAAGAMSLSSVFVLTNALRLRRFRAL